MSKVNVNTIEPSTGTDITLGASGDTITVPSGATITNSGTSTGFGPTLTGSTNNQVVTVTGANAITGETNLTFDGTDLTLGTGNIVFGTAAKGVYLGVTSATAANLLDDYEEGNWTPSYYGLGGTTPPTYSVQSGKYTKVGRSVTLTGTLTITAHNATGNMNLSGFPFNVGGSSDNGYYASWDYYMGGAGWQNLPAADYSGYTGVNTDRAPMHYVDSGEGHGETYFLIQTVCATSGTCILNFRLNYFTE